MNYFLEFIVGYKPRKKLNQEIPFLLIKSVVIVGTPTLQYPRFDTNMGGKSHPFEVAFVEYVEL
jgi:hypothetical protein